MPLSLNKLNLLHNPFNMLATMTVIRQDEEYSPQSPESTDPSPIATTPRNLSTIEGWKAPHATTDDDTFYYEGEPRRVYWDIAPNETFDSNGSRQVSSASSPSTTPPTPARQKHVDVFSAKRRVSQHTCEDCGQALLAKKTP